MTVKSRPRVRIPPAAPRRSKVRFAPTSFYACGKKDVIRPLPCSSFPTATRCAGLAVGGPPCGRHFSSLRNVDFNRPFQNRRTSFRMSFSFGFRRPKGGSTLQQSNCSAEAPARGCRLTDAADPLRGPAGFAAGAPPAGRRFRQNGRTMSVRPFLCLHKRERSVCRHPAVRPSASRRAAGPWPGSRRPRRRRRRPPGPGRWVGTCCSAWGWSAPA